MPRSSQSRGHNSDAAMEAGDVQVVKVKPGMAQVQTQANKAAKVQSQVDEVVGIMQNNIDKVMARGEKLDTLQSKTEDLSASTFQFKKTAVKLEREMWWKNIKLMLIIFGIVGLVATGGIVSYYNQK